MDEYTKHWTGRALLTPGAGWVAEQGRAWWLLDACVSWLPHKNLRGEDFIVFRLKVNADRSAVLTATDGNSRDRHLIRQVIATTDFPEDECELWAVRTPGQRPDAVIMTPAEY